MKNNINNFDSNLDRLIDKAYALSIGKRIKIAREKANMTQEEIANKIGCTSVHFSCIERGVKMPKITTLIKIVKVLNVSFDSILLDVDVSKYEDYDIYGKMFISMIESLPADEVCRILKVVKVLSETYSK